MPVLAALVKQDLTIVDRRTFMHILSKAQRCIAQEASTTTHAKEKKRRKSLSTLEEGTRLLVGLF